MFHLDLWLHTLCSFLFWNSQFLVINRGGSVFPAAWSRLLSSRTCSLRHCGPERRLRSQNVRKQMYSLVIYACRVQGRRAGGGCSRRLRWGSGRSSSSNQPPKTLQSGQLLYVSGSFRQEFNQLFLAFPFCASTTPSEHSFIMQLVALFRR